MGRVLVVGIGFDYERAFGARRGGNDDAFAGDMRLWEDVVEVIA